MVETILTILTALVTTAGVNGIFYLIFTKWYEHQYAKKLASHTAQLTHNNELELASFKHKLELAAAERNLRYSKIFEHTAETIATTYKKLLALKDAADEYTQPLSQSDASRQTAEMAYRQKAAEFLQYFRPNKIYLPKETAERIRVLSNTLYRSTMQFSMATAVARAPTREPETYGKLFDNFFKSSDEFQHLLELLEDDFQKLLGLAMADRPGM